MHPRKSTLNLRTLCVNKTTRNKPEWMNGRKEKTTFAGLGLSEWLLFWCCKWLLYIEFGCKHSNRDCPWHLFYNGQQRKTETGANAGY